nr:type I restriction endonuclease [uncultured Cohaesibacter sp.]
MNFSEQVAAIATRSKQAELQAQTEEATKTSVILPFIRALGFDVFNLDEVVPEFVSDVGTKKGERVDFALKIDGKVTMLIEAKPINTVLGDTQFNQLFRYFTGTDARLCILTNGREAWFFSDTEAANKMDATPFFRFDFQSHDKSQVEELSKFRKETFNIDCIIEAASNLKYKRNAADYLKSQFEDPDDDFVRLVGRQIHDGQMNKGAMDLVRPAIQSALDEIVRDRIQDKLGVAFSTESKAPAKPSESTLEKDDEVEADDGIETTEEEIQAYMIVRAIAAKVVSIDRVVIRDARSYCAILMDNINRKPICRLHFNSKTTKSIGVFDSDKNEHKHRIENLEDIYGYAKDIEDVVQFYADK